MFIAKKQNKCHIQLGRPIGGPSVLTLDDIQPELSEDDGEKDFFEIVNDWIDSDSCIKNGIVKEDMVGLYDYFYTKPIDTENTREYKKLGEGAFGVVVIDKNRENTVLKNIFIRRNSLRAGKNKITEKSCVVLNEINLNIKKNENSNFVRFLEWSYTSTPFRVQFQLRFERCHGSLESFLEENERPVVKSQVRFITTDIAKGLAALHDIYNIRHFDLKPGNVLFKDEVSGKRTRKWLLADFGCSSINAPNCATVLFQPGFLNKEIPIPANQLYVADLYAFGVLMSIILLPDKFQKILEIKQKGGIFDLEITEKIGKIRKSNELKQFCYTLLARNINGEITITSYENYIDNIILFFKEQNIKFSSTTSLTAMVHKYLHNYTFSDTFDIMSRLKKKLSSRTLKLLGKRGVE